MDAIVTARVDERVKAAAIPVLERHGYTPSEVIRELFSIIVQSNEIPFETQSESDPEHMESIIKRFNSLKIHGYSDLSDEDVRAMRLEERYADYL